MGAGDSRITSTGSNIQKNTIENLGSYTHKMKCQLIYERMGRKAFDTEFIRETNWSSVW